MHTRWLVLVVVLFGTMQEAKAQPLALSLRAGGMSAAGSLSPSPAFYPEVELRARLGRLAQGALSVQGAAYAGYWENGTEGVCRDCARYTHAQYAVGARVRFTAEQGSIPLTLSVGGARHLRTARSVNRAAVQGEAAAYGRRTFTTAEVGLGLAFPVTTAWTLSGEGLGFLPIRADENDPWARARFAVLVGVSYALR